MEIIIFLFQNEHKKNYETDKEDKERFEIFKATVQKIIEHNAKFDKGEVTFSMGLNHFADMHPEEFKCGGVLKK